jgi:hypothetical protein
MEAGKKTPTTRMKPRYCADTLSAKNLCKSLKSKSFLG